MAKTFMGYTSKKLAEKALKRGIDPYDYALQVSAKKNHGMPRYDLVREFFRAG